MDACYKCGKPVSFSGAERIEKYGEKETVTLVAVCPHCGATNVKEVKK